jgi:hypothetical protein
MWVTFRTRDARRPVRGAIIIAVSPLTGLRGEEVSLLLPILPPLTGLLNSLLSVHPN